MDFLIVRCALEAVVIGCVVGSLLCVCFLLGFRAGISTR